MNEESMLKIQRALSPNPKYEGMYFSGQKKHGKQKHKAKVSDKQRKIDHLSSRQKYELLQLHKELDSVLVANSRITRSGVPGKSTKKDARKRNGKLGAEGIWSNATFERYKKSCRTFLKYCTSITVQNGYETLSLAWWVRTSNICLRKAVRRKQFRLT